MKEIRNATCPAPSPLANAISWKKNKMRMYTASSLFQNKGYCKVRPEALAKCIKV